MPIIEEKAVQLMEKLGTIVAPEVIKLSESAMVVSGMGILMVGFSSLAACLVLALISKRSFNKLGDNKYPRSTHECICFGTGIFSFFLLIESACLLFNIWNWIAVINPRLAIVQKILNF